MNFDEMVLQHEVTIRLGFFFGVFTIMAVWEIIAPRRALTVSKTPGTGFFQQLYPSTNVSGSGRWHGGICP